MPKEIELQNGMKAIVDDEDYERVNQYNWVCTKPNDNNSVNISSYFKKEGEEKVRLHSLRNFILNKELKSGELVWQKNRNFLDCRKENLIIIDREKRRHLSKGRRGSSSIYKGVHYSKSKKCWVAKILYKGKMVYCNTFANERDAALAYNKYAPQYFGELCYLNKIGEDNNSNDIVIPKRNVNFKRKRSYNRTSHYKGVNVKKDGYYSAKIYHNSEALYLGSFSSEIEAAKAYNEKAKELFGDKAILNDIPNKEEYSC